MQQKEVHCSEKKWISIVLLQFVHTIIYCKNISKPAKKLRKFALHLFLYASASLHLRDVLRETRIGTHSYVCMHVSVCLSVRSVTSTRQSVKLMGRNLIDIKCTGWYGPSQWSIGFERPSPHLNVSKNWHTFCAIRVAKGRFLLGASISSWICSNRNVLFHIPHYLLVAPAVVWWDKRNAQIHFVAVPSTCFFIYCISPVVSD